MSQPIKLTGIQKLINKFMPSECEIRREALGHMNQSTGVPEAVVTVIYSGKCMINPMGSPSRRDRAVAAQTETMHEIEIPWDAPIPQANDICLVTVAGYDASMVGQEYIILGWIPSDFNVMRRLSARLSNA